MPDPRLLGLASSYGQRRPRNEAAEIILLDELHQTWGRGPKGGDRSSSKLSEDGGGLLERARPVTVNPHNRERGRASDSDAHLSAG